MLTREAWNALLKILEEPPPRVIFVFATTEPQKIQQAAPPILSRCQRFDFHRISTGDLVGAAADGAGVRGDHRRRRGAGPHRAEGGRRHARRAVAAGPGALVHRGRALRGRRAAHPGPGGDGGLPGAVRASWRSGARRTCSASWGGCWTRDTTWPSSTAAWRTSSARCSSSGWAAARWRPSRSTCSPTVAETAARFAPGDLLRMLAQVAELDADGRFRKSGEQRILIELLLLRFAYLESTVSLEDVLSAMGGGGTAAADRETAGRPGETSRAAGRRHLSARPGRLTEPAPPPQAASAGRRVPRRRLNPRRSRSRGRTRPRAAPRPQRARTAPPPPPPRRFRRSRAPSPPRAGARSRAGAAPSRVRPEPQPVAEPRPRRRAGARPRPRARVRRPAPDDDMPLPDGPFDDIGYDEFVAAGARAGGRARRAARPPRAGRCASRGRAADCDRRRRTPAGRWTRRR